MKSKKIELTEEVLNCDEMSNIFGAARKTRTKSKTEAGGKTKTKRNSPNPV